jgi:hypothetical protein
LENNLQNFNLDALFQKNNKLRTIDEWSYKKFDEQMGNKVQYGVVMGKVCTGKTTITKYMEQSLNMGIRRINMEEIQKENPPMDMTADPPAPIEGETLPVPEVEKLIVKMIKEAPSGTRWVFDSYLHKSEEDFVNFLSQFGTPDYIMFLNLSKDLIM